MDYRTYLILSDVNNYIHGTLCYTACCFNKVHRNGFLLPSPSIHSELVLLTLQFSWILECFCITFELWHIVSSQFSQNNHLLQFLEKNGCPDLIGCQGSQVVQGTHRTCSRRTAAYHHFFQTKNMAWALARIFSMLYRKS